MGSILSKVVDWAFSLMSNQPTQPVDLQQATMILPGKPIEELVADARKKLDMDVTHHFNFAVVGESGVGKSSFINALRRMKDSDSGAAPVGEIETTSQIQKYPHPTHRHVVLWDLPGAGTLRQPAPTYFEHNMLYAFDCILVLTGDRFMEIDFEIARKAKEFKRPCAFVRTKADQSVTSIAQREGKTMLEASKALRRMLDESFQMGLRDAGFSADMSFAMYIVSSRAFTKKQPYALYDLETGDLDTSLATMDEEQLVVFIIDSLRFRLRKGEEVSSPKGRAGNLLMHDERHS